MDINGSGFVLVGGVTIAIGVFLLLLGLWLSRPAGSSDFQFGFQPPK